MWLNTSRRGELDLFAVGGREALLFFRLLLAELEVLLKLIPYS